MERPYQIDERQDHTDFFHEVSEGGSNITPSEWDRAWAIEASARLAQIESGRVKSISLEETIARLRSILGE